jgi:hypothetical protein
MTSDPSRIFTIMIDEQPSIAFEADRLREATELCKEEWLRADLSTLTSNGVPICGARSKLKARVATQGERDAYRQATDEAAALSDDLLLVYLVELDGSGPTR